MYCDDKSYCSETKRARLYEACRLLAILLCATLGPEQVYAHQVENHVLRATHIEQAPIIDGRFDDPAWSQAETFSGFLQRDPKEGEPATEKTTVQLVYDDEALYVAIAAYDSYPEKIVSRLVRRDDYSDADWVQVSLDPHHDHQTGYFFEVNAGGSLDDGTMSNDDNDDDTWNGVWESKHRINDQGWNVEFKIPYHALRFNPADEYSWGINITRYISRKKESVYWVMVPHKERGWVSRFAHLEGIRDIEPKRSLEILPYSVGRSTFAPKGDANHRYFFGNVGASLRYGISSSTSLNASINPDFGQVEADPAELNLSVFETFQQERRPFFVEGSQSFDTPIDLFYSRRIGRQPGYYEPPDGYNTVDESDFTTILASAKITGKTESKTTFGLLAAVTAKEYARIETTLVEEGTGRETRRHRDFLKEPRSTYLIGRAKQDFAGGNSNIGLLATALNRDGGENAYSGGLDWSHKWADNGYRFWGQSAATNAIEDDERRSGWGQIAVLSKTSGNWRGDLWTEAYSPAFQPNDMGFQWRNDYYQPWLWIQYRDEEPNDFFRRQFYNINRWGMWNFDRDNLENGFNINTHHQFTNYWWLHGEFYHLGRALDDLDTRGGPLIATPSRSGIDLEIESDDRFMVSGFIEYEWERTSAGGKHREMAAGIQVRPTSNIEISVRPRVSWDFADAQWVENIDSYGDGEDDQYVYGQFDSRRLDLTTRASVLFSRDLSLELYIQPFIATGDYSDYKELARPASYSFLPHVGPEEDPDFRNRSLQSNLVLRWEYRPGSTFFLVWSQFRDDEGERPRFKPLSNLGKSFADEGTNIFLVKFNYWLLM